MFLRLWPIVVVLILLLILITYDTFYPSASVPEKISPNDSNPYFQLKEDKNPEYIPFNLVLLEGDGKVKSIEKSHASFIQRKEKSSYYRSSPRTGSTRSFSIGQKFLLYNKTREKKPNMNLSNYSNPDGMRPIFNPMLSPETSGKISANFSLSIEQSLPFHEKLKSPDQRYGSKNSTAATQKSKPMYLGAQNLDFDLNSPINHMEQNNLSEDKNTNDRKSTATIPECNLEEYDFEHRKKIGKGGQAAAYLVRHKGNRQQEYIYKAYRKKKEFYREIRIQAAINHPNIMSLKCIDSKKYAVMMPYLSSGDLWHQGLPYQASEAALARYSAQLILAVAAVHKAGYLHHDIKPQNLVRDSGVDQDHIELIDFGLAVPLSDADYDRGTSLSMSPEVGRVYGYRNAPLHEGLDWWSVGATIFILHALSKIPIKERRHGCKCYPYRFLYPNKNGSLHGSSSLSSSRTIYPDRNETVRSLNSRTKDSSHSSSNHAKQLFSPLPKHPSFTILPHSSSSSSGKDGISNANDVHLSKSHDSNTFDRDMSFYDTPSEFSDNLKSLLRLLMNPNPNRRRFTHSRLGYLQQHPYFSGIDWNTVGKKAPTYGSVDTGFENEWTVMSN